MRKRNVIQMIYIHILEHPQAGIWQLNNRIGYFKGMNTNTSRKQRSTATQTSKSL